MRDFDALAGSKRLGPVAGFYPVPSIESPGETQLWVPEVLQNYESRCLAAIIKSSGVHYDRIISLARGGFAVGAIVAYSNGHKNLHGIQTDGYDNDNNAYDEPELINLPDVTGIAEGENVLLTDELVDKGGAIKVTKEWAYDVLRASRVDTAVIYDKDKPHKVNVDYSVRSVPDLWLDHESQADEARRNRRLEELTHLDPEIIWTMGWLSTQPADVDFLRKLIDMSHGRFLAGSDFHANGS
ncbi:MAG: hypothetical protein M3Q79_00855 [bacterium]|nr:hypothetical protein [bacterium]